MRFIAMSFALFKNYNFNCDHKREMSVIFCEYLFIRSRVTDLFALFVDVVFTKSFKNNCS